MTAFPRSSNPMLNEDALAETTAARIAAEQEFERKAQECAAKYGFDVSTLSYFYSRYQFGSLSNNWEAADARRLYWRALMIAGEHERQELPAAAE